MYDKIYGEKPFFNKINRLSVPTTVTTVTTSLFPLSTPVPGDKD